MLTRDLVQVDWPTATVKVASFIDAAGLELLACKVVHIRALAHAPLEMIHIYRLFGNSKSAVSTAVVRRSIGRRIVQADIAEYCEGYTADSELYKVLGRFPKAGYNKMWSRAELIRALLKDG